MNCASCGTSLPHNALFCPGCGQRMTQRQAAPAPFAQTATRSGALAGTAHGGLPATRPQEPPLLQRDDLRAAVAANRELGPSMEADVIDAFLDRVEQSLDRRIDQHVDARLGGRLGRPLMSAKSQASALTGRIAASLGIGIPLTAISGGIGGVTGIIATWVGIVGLNVYYTEVERRHKV